MEPLGNIDLLEVCHYYRGLGLSYCWSYRRKEPDNTGTYGLIGVALKMPISGRWGGGGVGEFNAVSRGGGEAQRKRILNTV